MSFRCAICRGGEKRPWLEDIPDYEYGLPIESTLVRCVSCGAVQQTPLPTGAELEAFYPPDYHAYHYQGSRLGSWLKARYSRGIGQRIRAEIGHTGRILDVGCADGSFLLALEPMGDWELHGIDLNEAVVRRASSPRLRLRTGQLAPDTYPDEAFDAIVATHLVEHVPDPLEFLRICHRILRPGGIVIGELPNLDSWDFRLFRRHWGGLHLPRHLFFWDREGFEALGRRASFSEVETHPLLQPAHWAISLQNLAVSRLRLGGRLRRGRLPTYLLWVLAAVPICVLQNLAGKPSIMGFLFRKAGGGCRLATGPASDERP